MNVSSSRAPPPNVTTTAFRFKDAAQERRGDSPNSAAPPVAPVTVRRKSRRLPDTASAIAWGLPLLARNILFFLNCDHPVARLVLECLRAPARPSDLDLVNSIRRTEPEVQTQIALREIAPAAADLVHLRVSLRDHFYPCADRAPIRARAH